jgi:hypothetical protein
MDLKEAEVRFETAIGYCDAIVVVHGNYGKGKRGRRKVELPLNRAIVVLAVAAWQTVVQDLTTAALDHSCPEGTGGVGNLLRGQVVQQVAGFATPNAENSRNLMKLVDFDPFPCWTWAQAGGAGAIANVIRPHQAAERLNDWLKLRHSIAHGHPKLPVSMRLEHVRSHVNTWLATHPASKTKDALNHFKDQDAFEPGLRLKDAMACIRLVRRLAKLTARGLQTTGVGPAAAWTL